ncbi:MAG: nicotinate-nucleotide adenylyltransferase [Desulfomonilaceae bacterium]|nr:nicotinate-nucleotide adenylyltransferase [Desulfomonilaceae bacterium]
MKIGILGGTFNPPHFGHLRLAEEVAYTHRLDRIVFVPSYIPPHKALSEIASPTDRMNMTSLACEGNPAFAVSDMEIAAGGPSYTVDTLEALANERSGEIFFILGTDALREIYTWKNYERLFSLSHFIAVTRPGSDFRSAWDDLPEHFRAKFREELGCLVHAGSARVIPSTVRGLEISATMIRDLLKAGNSIRYLVPDSVRTYIMDTQLYRIDS